VGHWPTIGLIFASPTKLPRPQRPTASKRWLSRLAERRPSSLSSPIWCQSRATSHKPPLIFKDPSSMQAGSAFLSQAEPQYHHHAATRCPSRIGFAHGMRGRHLAACFSVSMLTSAAIKCLSLGHLRLSNPGMSTITDVRLNINPRLSKTLRTRSKRDGQCVFAKDRYVQHARGHGKHGKSPRPDLASTAASQRCAAMMISAALSAMP
jgi:hypothetical protein